LLEGLVSVGNLLTPLALFGLAATIASISFSGIIAMYFFRTYQLSGRWYLLGLPTGFAILATSFVFEQLNVVYSYSYHTESLENLFFWMQLSIQSEGFAFIALSYMLRSRLGSSTTAQPELLPENSKILFFPYNWIYHNTTRLKEIMIAILPMVLISVPLMITISALFVQPIFNDTEIKDMSIYTTVFNIIVLGYIIVKCLKPLVKAANLRLLYIPAAFGFLWLEQYSLVVNYFDNNQFAFIGSIIIRLTGLSFFLYGIYYALSRGRSKEMEIETITYETRV